MSRTTRSHSRRASVVAGLVLTAFTATAKAQDATPERALLNRIPPPTFGVTASGSPVSAPIDGARALLNPASAGRAGTAGFPGEPRTIAGEQALLGAVAPASRRLTLSW